MRPPEHLSKLWPLVDVVFRRLFDKPHLLCSLLNAILDLPQGEQLIELTIQPSQVAGPLADDKEVLLDIRARTSSGRQMHIEVQVRSFVAYVERMLFYCAGMYHGQLKSGRSYSELQQVVSVHILGFRLLPAEEQFRHWHHIFELLERRTHYRLTNHLEIHTIEMPKFLLAATELSTNEAKWLYYLLHGHEMSPEEIKALHVPEIEQADQELQMISQDRDLRVQYEMRLKAEMDAASWQKDHIALWLEQGKKLGHGEGLDEGQKLGLRRTVQEVCALLGIQLTAEHEAVLSKLSLEQMERLMERIKRDRTWPAAL